MGALIAGLFFLGVAVTMVRVGFDARNSKGWGPAVFVGGLLLAVPAAIVTLVGLMS